MITRDDILNTGVRDLLDVLALVPGFAPGVDVEGVVDLRIRGQWGHDGKILLLFDGQPMNELLYSTIQLADHYPLEMIDRIEVRTLDRAGHTRGTSRTRVPRSVDTPESVLRAIARMIEQRGRWSRTTL